MKSENFDVIVIGSGMGGLTAASLCAQLVGKRVLVLERHFKLGGFTHTFNRVGREWDVGVHYVGEMAPGAMPRAFFDLVTGGEIKWNALPDPIEKFVYPGFTFDVPVGESRYKNALVNRFPAEANALDGYFADVKRVARWSGLIFIGGMMPSVLRFFSNRLDGDTKRLALSPTADVLRRRFKNPELIALLPVGRLWSSTFSERLSHPRRHREPLFGGSLLSRLRRRSHREKCPAFGGKGLAEPFW